MLQTKGDYPPGSVKDCVRLSGPLADWAAAEEAWLKEQSENFGIYGFDHVTMIVPAIFSMIGAVQRNWISGPDFFSDGLFVFYDEPRKPDNPGQGSHHSGWRLLREADQPEGIVLLSRSNPGCSGIEILVEGDPPKEWVEEVIRAYYTARRTAMVAQSNFRRDGMAVG